VIIHKGKVVAVDTPKNLSDTRQKKSLIHLTVDAPLEDIRTVLMAVKGVKNVTVDGYVKEGEMPVAVETEPASDLRRLLASTIVNKGWGLLEMKPILMSLEEIFVDVVTEEPADTQKAGDSDVKP
jgi:ABC-2 type transport system ATP-binding protein